MEKSIEKIPSWCLCYFVNGDPTGLTDDDIKMADDYLRRNNVELVCPINETEEAGAEPYFTSYPAFGLPCDVVDCIVLFRETVNDIEP